MAMMNRVAMDNNFIQFPVNVDRAAGHALERHDTNIDQLSPNQLSPNKSGAPTMLGAPVRNRLEELKLSDG